MQARQEVRVHTDKYVESPIYRQGSAREGEEHVKSMSVTCAMVHMNIDATSSTYDFKCTLQLFID